MNEFVPSSWLLGPIDIDEIESEWLDSQVHTEYQAETGWK